MPVAAAGSTAGAGVMSKKVVILGGGTGGTLVANRLRRELGCRRRPGAAGEPLMSRDLRDSGQELDLPFGALSPSRRGGRACAFRLAGTG